MSRRQPRYPFGPLVEWCRARHRPADDNIARQTRNMTDCGVVASVTGFNFGTVYMWERDGGLTERAADQVAVELDLHPMNLWPDWGLRSPELAPQPTDTQEMQPQ